MASSRQRRTERRAVRLRESAAPPSATPPATAPLTEVLRKDGPEATPFCVYSEDGSKSLGCYATEDEAKDRLAQVEMAKHAKSMEAAKPTTTARVRFREAPHAVRVLGKPLDAEGRRWPIAIIAVGESVNAGPSGKQLYYTAEALRAAAPVFEGAKSYTNHPTEDEQRQRPERDLRDLSGFISDVTFDEASGQLLGVWNVVDDALRTKQLNAHALGKADLFGFSINAAGETSIGTVAGKEYELVMSIAAVPGRSVDAVTEPAAKGGFLTTLAASVRGVTGGQSMEPKTFAELKAANASLAAVLLEAAKDEDARAVLAGMKASAELIESVMAERKTLAEAAKNATPAAAVAAATPAPVAPAPVATTPAPAATAGVPAGDTVAIAAAIKKAVEETMAPFREAERKKAIDAAVAGLAAEDVALLRPLLESESDDTKRTKLVESYRARLAAASAASFSPNFAPGTMRDGGIPVTLVADQRERFESALQGWMAQGHRRKCGTVEEQPFTSLHEAILTWPGHAHVRFPTPDFIQKALGVPYHSGKRRDISNGRWAEGPWVMREGRKWVPFREAISTTGFGEIFADVAFKELMLQYTAESDYQSLLRLASKLSYFTDFKPHRSVRFGGYANFSAVAEGGTYPTMTTPTDNEEKVQLVKYGGIETLTWESTLDPDGAKLSSLFGAMGEAMGRTFREAILNRFTTDNPTLNSDSTALYDSTHNNTGTTAFSVNAIRLVVEAMMKQTQLSSSKRLGAKNLPKFLFGPIELQTLASRILTVPKMADFITSVSNAGTDTTLRASEWAGSIEWITLTHNTASAVDWYAMADPTKMPTIEIARMAGVDVPELFSKMDPESDTMWTSDQGGYKVRFPYDVEPLEFRSHYRQDVT